MGLKLAALVALLAGLALIGYGISTGDVRVGFFLIIPFVYGTGVTAALGMLLVMAALILWTLGRFREMAAHAGGTYAPPERGASQGGAAAWEPERRRTKSGGVVLLGPIPIVWGSDRKILPWMVGAGIVLTILALWLSGAFR